MYQCPEICENHLKTYQIDINNIIRQKRPKKAKFHWPFFKNKKKPKELKKGQKLQIWPQKSQTGNPGLKTVSTLVYSQSLWMICAWLLGSGEFRNLEARGKLLRGAL